MKKLTQVLLVTALAATSCGPGTTTATTDDSGDTTESTETTTGANGDTTEPTAITAPDVVTLVGASGEVGCAIGQVGVGDPGSSVLQSIADCNEPIPVWERLVENGRVTTDDDGEAQVKLDEGGTCGLLYVFRSSELLVSDCQKGATATACVASGSIGFNNECSGVLQIHTPSASVTLIGTWVTVTYNPQNDLTLVTVLDGAAEVEPVDDRGEVTLVESGAFYFTSRGDELTDLARLESRTAIGVAELPRIIAATSLESRYAGVLDRARIDQVLPAELEGLRYFNLRAGGETLANVKVADAILQAVDWQVIVKQISVDSLASIDSLMGSAPGLDTTKIPFAVEETFRVLEESNVSATVVFVYEERDTDAAVEVLRSLGELGNYLAFERFPVADSSAARKAYAELLAEGQDVMWIGRS